MKLILSFFMIALSLCIVNAADAKKNYSSFTASNAKSILPCAPTPIISYFNGTIKNDRVLLNWAIDNNKETDRFEVERSADGKTFVMVALVFGSEQTAIAEYQFYEKVKKAKSFYRLKLINKDNTITYSTIIKPEPNPD